MRDVAQRLRRLLYVVPYVAKHADGVDVDELADLVGLDQENLVKELNMLNLVGPPDGDPGEYLLVSVEDGRVYVDLPQRLTRPLRLTPAEGCSLLLGIRALRDSGIAPYDDAMKSAENKLLRALGKDAQAAENLASGTVVAEADQAIARSLQTLVASAKELTQVTFSYASASRGTAEKRQLDPYGVVHHAGVWYVVGKCHKRGDVRTFRLDRIQELQELGAHFEMPTTFSLEEYRREHLYVPSADAISVHIKLDSLAVARVGANWPNGNVTLHDDGSAEIIIDCEGLEWVTGWVLGFGRHAWITGPQSAKDAMRERVLRLKKSLGLSSSV